MPQGAVTKLRDSGENTLGRMLRAHWFPICLIFEAVFLVFLWSLNNGYIWDDNAHVLSNKTLRNVAGLGEMWTNPQALPQYYPLTHTFFWIEYHLWGLDLRAYHLGNLLLQALTATSAGLLLTRLKIPGAWLAALLFAIHPVQVESVAWISEAKNLLSGLFYFWAWLAYLKHRDLREAGTHPARAHGQYLWATFLFACALLSKTPTCTLPGAILLGLWWQTGRIAWRDVWLMTPWFVLGLALGLFTAWMEKNLLGVPGTGWSWTFTERCLIAGHVFWFYLAKLVWPQALVAIYPTWEINAGAWEQYLYPVAVVVVIVVLWRLRHRLGRGPLAAALYFAGTLFPGLGFFDYSTMRFSFVADHYQYLACLGPFALGCAALVQILPKFARAQKRLAIALAGLILAGLGTLSWQQTKYYRNEETLWTHTLAENPTCTIGLNNLGVYWSDRGQSALAMVNFQAALRNDPQNFSAWSNLGRVWLDQGQVDQAIASLREALDIRPHNSRAHANLGDALAKKGQNAEAAREYREAIRLNADLEPVLRDDLAKVLTPPAP